MAKKFFYVCAGLFLLALSYHLGARMATAQSGGLAFFGSSSRSNTAVAIYPNGDVYFSDPGWAGGAWTLGSNVFGGAANGRTVVQVDGGEGSTAAVASTGEIFHTSMGGGLGAVWTNHGVPPGGATGAVPSSWGALKVRSR